MVVGLIRRVVHHDDVAAGHEVDEVDEAPIDEALAVDVKQAARAARGRGRLRDELAGKRVVEVVEREPAVGHRGEDVRRKSCVGKRRSSSALRATPAAFRLVSNADPPPTSGAASHSRT